MTSGLVHSSVTLVEVMAVVLRSVTGPGGAVRGGSSQIKHGNIRVFFELTCTRHSRAFVSLLISEESI